MTAEIGMQSVTEVSALYRRGKVSQIAVVRELLDRIGRHEGKLNAWITIRREEARVEARRAEEDFQAGGEIGPLHGVPIALKDNIDTAGMRTTCAARILADHVPKEDATVVRRLREAGGDHPR